MMDALAPGQAFRELLAGGIAGTRIVVARFAAGRILEFLGTSPRLRPFRRQGQRWYPGGL